MVDRFVNTEAESYAFGMRVITVRQSRLARQGASHAAPALGAIAGRAGLAAAPEDAALMLNDLLEAQRLPGAQHAALAGQQRPVDGRGQDAQPQLRQGRDAAGQRLARLRAADGAARRRIQARVSSAVVARRQSDRRHPEVRDRPGRKAVAGRSGRDARPWPAQTQRIEVPQAISARLHERFRWPADQVLVISLGVVPTPVPPSAGHVEGAAAVAGHAGRSVGVHRRAKARSADSRRAATHASRRPQTPKFGQGRY